MKLSDQDTLELTALCNALVDGQQTAAGRARLEQLLAGSAAAREFYVRFMGLSASLCHYAAELPAEAPDVAIPPRQVRWSRGLWWGGGALAAAAAAALVLIFSGDFPGRDEPVATAEEEPTELVAQVTGVENCRWADASVNLQPDDQLHSGQRLELVSGVIEITFDSGAQVTLAGPATLEVNTAWDATLHEGTLDAVVPAEAIGFRISNPAVDVVDLGTEFSIVATRGGATEVYVTKGQVQTLPHDAGGGVVPAVLLKADQAWTFGRGGNVELKHPRANMKAAAKARKCEQPLVKQPVAHYHFDEPKDPAVVTGVAKSAGRFGQALQFNGRNETQLAVRGFAHNRPHTVAFWVKVPAGAQIHEAGAMAAWCTAENGKDKVRPVQIGWNTDPAAGPLGALATECSRGSVVGSTPLRDGRWHHVAVVFVPQHGRLHVKQYVDGRLEGEKLSLAKRHRHEKNETPTGNVIWLGRRLGHSRPGQEHFRGELDELFVADRALPPQQIKELLTANQLGGQVPVTPPVAPGKYSL